MKELRARAGQRRYVALRPNPSREHNVAQTGLAEARRDIDQQVANAAIGAGFEVLTNRLDCVAAADERCAINGWPRLGAKIIQAHFEIDAVEFEQRGIPVDSRAADLDEQRQPFVASSTARRASRCSGVSVEASRVVV